MKKFWTTRDNVIGTAHTNRHGEVVDFRPARWVEVTGQTLVLKAQEGQGVEDLVLPVTRAKKRLMGRSPSWPQVVGRQEVEETFCAEFLGVEVSTEKTYWEWVSVEAEQECHRVEEARRAKEKAEMESAKAFAQGLVPVVILSCMTRRQVGRLRSGRLRLAEVVEPILAKECRKNGWDAAFIMCFMSNLAHDVCKGDMKERILALDDERRRMKKVAWLES